MAAVTGSNGSGQGDATGDGGAPKRLHHQAAFGRGLLGLAVASAAITMAVSEPPPWLDRNAYFAALSGAFFAGMAQVVASVVRPGDWVAGGRSYGARRMLVVLVVVAACLTAASLLL